MPDSPVGLTWVLTERALAELASDPAVREVFAVGRVYCIMRSPRPPVDGVWVLPTFSSGSAAELVEAAESGTLPQGTRALLYDPEHWPFTPPEEQRDVAGAVAIALDVARRHDLTLIATPAVTLTRVLAPRGAAMRDRYKTYLRTGIARLAAAADIVDVQAQSAVRETRRYVRVVAEAAAQVREVNPAAGVVAGLSTNPPGDPVDAPMLTRAVHATLGTVDGYWLNVPSPGPHCPTCNPPRPDIGIAALRAAFY